MESTGRNDLKVGIFVAAGALTVMAVIIAISGGARILTSSYDVKMKMKHVQGLGVGSVVSLAGLNVGNVASFKIAKDNPEVEVTLSIETTYQDLIRKDSKAEVKTQGALGDKFIFIEAGSPDQPRLEDGDFLSYEQTPDFLDLIASKGSEIGQIGDVVKELKILLANVNQDGTSKKLAGGLDEAKRSMVRLNSILTKIDNGQGTLGALINDRSLHDRLLSLTGDSGRSRFLKPLIRETIKNQDQAK